MFTLKRTTSDNADFICLVQLLDAYLSVVDGDEHAFYAQYNKTDSLKHVVVCYAENKAVGCGAIREYTTDAVEIKRMFVLPESRGKGIAGAVLRELETWAAELHFTTAILETNKKQTDAIHLYYKSGYSLIPNYGQYENIEDSVCMQKVILPTT